MLFVLCHVCLHVGAQVQRPAVNSRCCSSGVSLVSLSCVGQQIQVPLCPVRIQPLPLHLSFHLSDRDQTDVLILAIYQLSHHPNPNLTEYSI